MRKAVETGANMQYTLDSGDILSENDSTMEIEEEVASMRASLSKKEVPSKVVLGYISPNWSKAHTVYPKLQKHFMLKETLYFIFIVKFVIIDQVGSRMIVINYAEYFI